MGIRKTDLSQEKKNTQKKNNTAMKYLYSMSYGSMSFALLSAN